MAARFVERVSRPGSDFDEGNTNPRTGFVAGSPQPSPLGSPGTERVNRPPEPGPGGSTRVRRTFSASSRKPQRDSCWGAAASTARLTPHPGLQGRVRPVAAWRGSVRPRWAAHRWRAESVRRPSLHPLERRDRTRRRSTRCQGDPCDPPRRTTPAWTGASAARLGRSGAGPARFGFHVAWHAEIAGRAPAARHNADDTSRVPEIRRRPLGVSSRQQGTRALSQRTE